MSILPGIHRALLGAGWRVRLPLHALRPERARAEQPGDLRPPDPPSPEEPSEARVKHGERRTRSAAHT